MQKRIMTHTHSKCSANTYEDFSAYLRYIYFITTKSCIAFMPNVRVELCSLSSLLGNWTLHHNGYWPFAFGSSCRNFSSMSRDNPVPAAQGTCPVMTYMMFKNCNQRCYASENKAISWYWTHALVWVAMHCEIFNQRLGSNSPLLSCSWSMVFSLPPFRSYTDFQPQHVGTRGWVLNSSTSGTALKGAHCISFVCVLGVTNFLMQCQFLVLDRPNKSI